MTKKYRLYGACKCFFIYSTVKLPGLYVVQTGVYRLRRNAEAEVQQLRELGAPAYMVAQNGLFYVRAGAFRELDRAVRMEQSLRRLGYSTVILRT